MSAAKVCGFRMTGQEAGAGAGCDAAAGMLAKITLLKSKEYFSKDDDDQCPLPPPPLLLLPLLLCNSARDLNVANACSA
jgi:hypothetical protein